MTGHEKIQKPIGRAEFTGLMALMMSLAALTIDAMLPAMAQIGESLSVKNPNDNQLIISSVFVGMALGLMLYGPLSDSYGRKKAVYLGLFIYLLGSFVSIFSSTFTIMLLGRILQGFGTAACRVITIAMIRDKFSGREMARAMSLIMIIFIMVPAIAPSLGQAILLFFNWRAIFGLFVFVGLAAFFWLHFRQPETLAKKDRRSFSLKTIFAGILETLRNPRSRGFTLASGLVFGALIGYLSSSQQVFQTQYGLGEKFPLYFGSLALVIGLSSFANSKLVMRFGMHRLCLTALIILSVNSTAFYLYSRTSGGHPPISHFMGYLMVSFFCFGLLFGNLNTLAIEPLGHIAGVANSVMSSIQTLVSVSLGGLIGRLYDGTVLPLVFGFMIFGYLSLALTIHTSRKPTLLSLK